MAFEVHGVPWLSCPASVGPLQEGLRSDHGITQTGRSYLVGRAVRWERSTSHTGGCVSGVDVLRRSSLVPGGQLNRSTELIEPLLAAHSLGGLVWSHSLAHILVSDCWSFLSFVRRPVPTAQASRSGHRDCRFGRRGCAGVVPRPITDPGLSR
jgi:hypothetical protein